MRTPLFTMILLLAGTVIAFGEKGKTHHDLHPWHSAPPRAAIVESVPVRQVARPLNRDLNDRSPDDRIKELEQRIEELERQLKETLTILLKTLGAAQESGSNGSGA